MARYFGQPHYEILARYGYHLETLLACAWSFSEAHRIQSEYETVHADAKVILRYCEL